MSDSNIGGEASILEERRRKLEELREKNIAFVNTSLLLIRLKNCMIPMVT